MGCKLTIVVPILYVNIIYSRLLRNGIVTSSGSALNKIMNTE